MSDKSSTIFWKDGDGCHWCRRKAISITGGHDGMCPVPYTAQLEAEKEQQAQTILDCQKKIAQLARQLDDALLKGADESMSLSDVKEKYLPNRDVEDLRKKPETPISDVPITP